MRIACFFEWPFGESIEDGKEEGGRFAGSCLGEAENVTAVEDHWDRFFLNGSGRCKSHFFDPSLKAGIKF